MGPVDDKYVVFKRAEWNRFKAERVIVGYPDEVPDAVVIRRQDMFAPPMAVASWHTDRKIPD